MKNIIFQKVAKLIKFCKNCMKFNKNWSILIKILCFFHFFCLFLNFLSFLFFLFLKGIFKALLYIIFPARKGKSESEKWSLQKNHQKIHFLHIYTRNALFGDFFACHKSLDKFCWQKKVFESMSYVMWDMHSIDLSNAGKKIIDRLIRFFQNNKKDKKMIKKWKK